MMFLSDIILYRFLGQALRKNTDANEAIVQKSSPIWKVGNQKNIACFSMDA